jgi:hypothetical protein
MNEVPRFVPRSGNWIYVIKPTDMQIPEPNEIKGKLKLHHLQAGVGGLIEVVPYFHHIDGRFCVAFCDEEGKIKNKSINRLAHALWEASLGRPITEDHLVGDIVIIVGSQEFLSTL